MRAFNPAVRFAVVVVLSATAGCLPDRDRPVVVPVSEERCLTCHADEQGFSPFHRPELVGCVSCHGGDPVETGEDAAHQGMRTIPGNLADAAISCGASGCHPDQVARVSSSLMATARGIVSVNRWVFGEQPTPDGHPPGRGGTMADLGDSPADSHLRSLCASCHLGSEKSEIGPLQPLSRGGGCLACHLTYDPGATHARLTIDVPSTRCFGCHSRSGRISTNYAGWHETVLGYEGIDPADTTLTILADGRVFERAPTDVHHDAGLECIDCHTSREVMGDGTEYAHQEQAIETTCSTCHAASRPRTLAWGELTEEDRRVVSLRSGTSPTDRRFVASDRTGRALVNVFLGADGRPVLEGKLDGLVRPLAAPADACARPGHERLSCQSCHTSWAPQCLGCHTQRTSDGEWTELISDFRAEPPVLGVRSAPATAPLGPAGSVANPPARSPGDSARSGAARGRIEPFIPGMIMTLNPVPTHSDPAASVGTGTFHRLYAPAVPHTTSAKGRTCESCHLDPLALGFGRGRLTLDSAGAWRFEPEFSSARDGLPADAWTPFLRPALEPNTTRTDARPFTPAEQWAILRVGACLECHEGEGAASARIYQDFGRALERVTASCRIPAPHE